MGAFSKLSRTLFGTRPLRSFRLWSLLALLIYTLAGFFLVPWLVEKQLVEQFKEQYGREATVGQVRVNPFVLSMTVDDFQLKDPDGELLTAFDQLYVNFQTSSLFRWAWTFAEIRLERPRFAARVNEQGQLSIADMLADSEPSDSAPPDDPDIDRAPVRLILFDVGVNDGHVMVSDRSRPTPFEQDITPITFQLTEFSTLPEAEGPYSLNMELPNGARFSWQGTISVAPFRSDGKIAFNSMQLETPWRYIQDQVAFAIESGLGQGETRYNLSVTDQGIDLSLDQLSVGVSDLHLRAQTRQQRDIEIPELSLTGGSLNLTEKTFHAAQVRVVQAQINSVLPAEGEAELIGMFVPNDDEANPAPDSADADDQPWQISFDSILLSEASILSVVQKVEPAAQTQFSKLNLELTGFDLEPETRFGLHLDSVVDQVGMLTIDGEFGVFPPLLEAQVSIQDLPLVPYQSYLQQAVNIEIADGQAAYEGTVSLHLRDEHTDVALAGRAGLSGLSLRDRLAGETLLGIGSLEMTGLTFALPDAGLAIERADLAGLETSVLVDEQGQINLADAFSAPGSATEPAVDESSGNSAGSSGSGTEVEPSEALPVTLATLAFNEGTVTLIDESIDPRYRVALENLNGTVSGLSSENLARAEVDLKAMLDGYAQVTIKGQINPLSKDLYTDLAVTLDGYEMTSVTPYSGRYLGQKVDQGKLSLDLNYHLSERDLVGENKIILDRFGLGEAVATEDAIGLPVGLAIALLKDSNGRIDIDVPVSGNLDDPDFGVGHLVVRAVFNLITGIVTSPFKLLGSLAGGGGSAELDHVMFDPGQMLLQGSFQERVDTLAGALKQRPQLRLEIRAAFNEQADGRAMALAALAGDLNVDPEILGGSALEHLEAMATMADQTLGAEAVQTLIDNNTAAPIEGADAGVLDSQAYAEALLEALIESRAVDPEQLRELAQARAQAVLERLVEVGEIPADRIFVLEAAAAPASEEGIKMEFVLTAQ